MLPEPLGDRVARYRNLRDMSQAQLAAKMQLRGHRTITDTRINEIEQNRRRVTIEELVGLARVLNMPISELLGVPDYAKE